MTQSARIKINPTNLEVEIEGSEAFVKKYFSIIQGMLAGTPAKVKDKAAPKKRGRKKAAATVKPAKKPGPKKISMTGKIIALVQKSSDGISVDDIVKKNQGQ